MKWGWLARGAKVAAKVAGERTAARLEAENDALRSERDYWKGVAERLLDSTLTKGGHPPVMTPPATTDPSLGALRGLALHTVPPKPVVVPREGMR